MTKIVFIGAVKTLSSTELASSDIHRYINPDNIVLATLKKTQEGWVWNFVLSEGTSLDSMVFEHYNLAKSWAVEHDLVQNEE